MPKSQEVFTPGNEYKFTIIGHGAIGEKARQLQEKSAYLRQLGFYLPPRVVIAQDFLDEFIRGNELGSDMNNLRFGNAKKHITRGTFTADQAQQIRAISQHLGDQPLVVRSSAAGDARGTGTYSCVFVDNDQKAIESAIKDVMISYHSPSARLFRRDAGIGKGLGIIIEPIIGQTFDDIYGPVLSGHGFTSTSYGKGYVSIVPGLGCGVNTKYDERVTRQMLSDYDGILEEYLVNLRLDMSPKHQSLLLRNKRGMSPGDLGALMYYLPQYGYPGTVSFAETTYTQDVEEVLSHVNINPLFDVMTRMEKIFGYPQYFEWAMTVENGGPKFWIVQIADIDKRVDDIEFGNYGRVIFKCHTVTGAGVKEATKIVICKKSEDIDLLRKFNQKNSNYILFISGKFISDLGDNVLLSYEDYSNASVFIEIPYLTHRADLRAHFSGQLDLTQKFLAVLDTKADVAPNWVFLAKNTLIEDGLEVHTGNFKILASEKQGRMVVYAL